MTSYEMQPDRSWLAQGGGIDFGYPQVGGNNTLTGAHTALIEWPGGEITLTGSPKSASYLFNNWLKLKTAPPIDTAGAVAFNHMFKGCKELSAVPFYDTSSGTNFAAMFEGCSYLRKIPQLDLSSATSTSGMFSGCYWFGLDSVGVPDGIPTSFATPNLTVANQMFYNCMYMHTAPMLDTAKVTTFASFYEGCNSLTQTPPLDMSAATDASRMFTNCYNLTRAPLVNVGCNLSMVGTKLTAEALNELFTGLQTVAAGTRTITITAVPGAATCDKTIATNKGWTVTG